MKIKSVLQWSLLLLLCVGVMGAECPSIPTVEEKVVELVMGASATTKFEARGLVNVFGELQTIDLEQGIDLEQVLDDAGIDVNDVKHISLSGVSYRVVKPDPTPTRAIQGGYVLVGIGTTPDKTLVRNFNESPVNAVVDWKAADLHPDGVAVLNSILQQYLTALQTGAPLPGLVVSYLPIGVSTPVNVDTDFDWELKIDINIVGTVKVDVLG